MLGAGTQIDRYELICPIGEGGMAEVWVARQRGKHGFAKLFALKAIHSRFADQQAFRSMFLDEARIAAAIEHLNVAQVFDLGESESMLYLVMEYVDGESLGTILASMMRTSGHASVVPIPVALRIVADMCAGLHAAHRLTDEDGNLLAVVHRDVSPQNVLLSAKGDVKLIDFGIAHANTRLVNDTGDGTVKGKLNYMSPEQARHEEIGPYSDVFSAGATLYRMLAGQAPYDGQSDAVTLGMLLAGTMPAPLPSYVPQSVASIVERALMPEPADRYATAFGMQSAIESVIAEEGYVANVEDWVRENLSPRYQQRRAAITARTDAPPPMPAPKVPSLPIEASPTKASAGVALPDVQPASLAEIAQMHAVPTSPPAPPREREIMSFSAAANEPKLETLDGPRSFMDLAGIARARIEEAERKERAGDAPAGPSQAPRPVPVVAPKAPGRSKAPLFAGIFGAAVLCVALLALMLPGIVRKRLVATAHEAGLELEVESMSLGFSGASLRHVTVTSSVVPSVTVKVDEIIVTGWSAQSIRVIGADARINGTVDEVGAQTARLYEQNKARFAGKPTDPRRVSIASAHLAWTRPFGEGTRLEASEVSIDVDSRAAGSEELRGSVGRFEFATAKTTLGPWMASGEHAPTSTRLRVAFDPAVPDGPSLVYLGGKATASQLTVKIPRSPLANLGLRPQELGLPADPTSELEVKIEGSVNGIGRTDGKGSVYLYGARIPGWKSPVDVKLDANASGASGRPLELERAVASVGPFVALVNGTIAAASGALKVDGTWKTQPLPCERFARAEAKSLGTFAATIQEIAQATGAVRVTGTASASGAFHYDSAAPDRATFTIATRDGCGISLFGR